ncbi:MAG: ferredoxin [Candidatus Aenigmatarchaeota archaeon]
MPKFKVEVDKGKCIGCGMCASVCPDIFELKGGKAHVKKAQLDKPGCSTEAESNCPVRAIRVTKL